VRGVLIYMAIYMVMTLGAFACILAMRRNGSNVEQIAISPACRATNPLMATIWRS
jgi:NADH-quinone oxidoreductase subunit N